MSNAWECSNCSTKVVWDDRGAYCPKKCFDSRPTDMVNHPSHYTQGGIETIDIMKAKLTPEQFEGYLLGNVIKYTTRYNLKNGVEDLKKAQWYLNYIVEMKKPLD